MNTRKSPSIIPTLAIFISSWFICLLLIGGAVCSDGWGSGSIGRSGACSHHGGVSRWPNILAFFGSGFLAFIFHEFRSRNGRPSSQKSSQPPFIQPSSSESTATPPTPSVRQRRRKKNDSCPRCKSSMVLRTAKKGANAGNQFFGCSCYPRCKGTRPFKD